MLLKGQTLSLFRPAVLHLVLSDKVKYAAAEENSRRWNTKLTRYFPTFRNQTARQRGRYADNDQRGHLLSLCQAFTPCWQVFTAKHSSLFTCVSRSYTHTNLVSIDRPSCGAPLCTNAPPLALQQSCRLDLWSSKWPSGAKIRKISSGIYKVCR